MTARTCSLAATAHALSSIAYDLVEQDRCCSINHLLICPEAWTVFVVGTGLVYFRAWVIPTSSRERCLHPNADLWFS